MFQAEARSTAQGNEKSSELTHTNTKSLTNILQEAKSLYSGIQAVSSLGRVTDLSELKKWPHIDPEACINITVDVASFEELALSTSNFGMFLYSASLGVGKQIFNCRTHLPNGFELVKCAISQLSDTEPIMEVVWEQLYGLVDQAETNYNQIVSDINKCIGKSLF